MRWSPILAGVAIFLLAELTVTVVSNVRADDHGRSSATAAQHSRADQQPSKLLHNWDNAEPNLTSDQVIQSDFGKRWSTTIDGTTSKTPNQMYAKPLVFDGKIYLATEENEVEIIDEQTGRKIAARNLGTPWTPVNCGDLTPHIGITSTPVIDVRTHTIYVITKLQVPGSTDAVLKMWGLRTDNLATRKGWPLNIKGIASNSSLVFDADTANQRVGLTVDDKHAVYFATASHCTHGPYVGFVGRVSTSSGSPGSLHLWSAETARSIDAAGIWQSGGAVMTDGDDANGNPRLFVATGTGTPPSTGPGNRPPGSLAQSIIRLGVDNTTGDLRAQDFFSPANADQLNGDDDDVGSGAPTGLPKSFGNAAHRELLTEAGKDGTAYLLDRRDLGGSGQGPNGTNASLSSINLGSGVWGHAAVFDGGTPSTRLVYYQASHEPLQAFTTNANGAGVPTLARVANGAEKYGYGSSSPTVSSDGKSTTAVVWLTVSDGNDGSNGYLVAYPAIPPTNGAWKPLRKFSIGLQNKFTGVATAGGQVLVGTKDGRILAFGGSHNGAVTATSATFAPQPADGSTHQRTVLLNARRDVTISALATSSATIGGKFSVEAGKKDLPIHLAAGERLPVSVAFSTHAPGKNAGQIVVRATPDATNTPTEYVIPLTGTGTRDGLLALPGSLAFHSQPTRSPATESVTIENTSTSPITLTRVDPPRGAFSLSGSPPSAGYRIPALGSVAFTVQFEPRAVASYSASLSVSATLARTGKTYTSTIPVTGRGVHGAPKLAITGPHFKDGAYDFNIVAPGQTKTVTIDIKNVGNVPDRINKAAVPSEPFEVAHPLDEGMTLEPGESVSVDVTAVPTTGDLRRDHYILSDANGLHYIWFVVNSYRQAGEIRGGLGCVTDYHLIRTDGTPIVVAPCNGTRAQILGMDSTGGMHFFASYGDFCMDVADEGTTPGTPIHFQTCDRSKAQRWVWSLDGRLVNPHSNLCLAVRGNRRTTGTPLVLAGCDASSVGQIWDPTAMINTRGELTSDLGADGQYCVTGPKYGASRGTKAVVRACDLQTFSGLDNPAANAAPSQVIAAFANTLRVAGGCLTQLAQGPGASVAVAPCSYATNQQWLPSSHGSIVNKRTRLCMAVRGTAPGASGTRDLVMSRCDGSVQQTFDMPDD